MKRLLALLQFLPLSVFLAVAKSQGLTEEAWKQAFIWGAVAGLLELAILIPLCGNQLNRLILSANLFLLFGGLSFYFEVSPFLNILGILRESGVLLFLGVVSAISLFASPTGVFEQPFSPNGLEKKYSVYYLIAVSGAFAFSFTNRGNQMLAGVFPFVALVILKVFFQHRLRRI